MGQARLRGTFEQRQAEGIAKQQAEAERRQLELIRRKREARMQEALRLRRMTYEERKKAYESKRVTARLDAFLSSYRGE